MGDFISTVVCCEVVFMLLPFMDNDLLPSRSHFRPEVRHSGHIKLPSLAQDYFGGELQVLSLLRSGL